MWNPIFEILVLGGNPESLIAHIQGYGIWGPVMLTVIQLVQVIVPILPGQPFLIIAGVLYGFLPGVIFNLLSTSGASLVAFGLARNTKNTFIERFIPRQKLDHWMARTNGRGAMYFLIIYMLPFFPTDILNFVAGLTEMSRRQFLLANLCGRLPMMILMTLIGSHGLALPW